MLHKKHTSNSLSLLAGLLLVSFVFMTVSGALLHTGLFGEKKCTETAFCQDSEPSGTEAKEGEKKCSGEETGWCNEELIFFHLNYKCGLISVREIYPDISLGFGEMQMPPPKFNLI